MELSPGASLGHYRLIEPIGAGGMAEVWRAYHPGLDLYVAIKILPRRFASDPSYLERFRREAQAVSRLDHPNILRVHDFGEQDGITYMVSPYVAGGTLAGWMGQPWPMDRAISVLSPLASALDYAHRRGIVHRDVKPSNVLLTDDGQVILGDFGIARAVEGANTLGSGEDLTRQGVLIGTPQYMAPEQANLQPATQASDLYALGVMLYQMLTGRVPFEAETWPETLRAHLYQPLPPPRTLNPALSEAVQAVLLKALAKDPNERYPSGAALVGALAAAERSTRSTQTLPPTAPLLAGSEAGAPAAPAPPGRRARPGMLVGIIAGSLLAAAAILLLFLAPWRTSDREVPAQTPSLGLATAAAPTRDAAGPAAAVAPQSSGAAGPTVAPTAPPARPAPAAAGPPASPSAVPPESSAAAAPKPPGQAALLPCDGPQPTLVTSRQVVQVPVLAEPAPRTPFRDPAFSSCLVRVTDRKTDLSPDDNSGGLRNQYSSVQAFNADGSRLLLQGTDGAWYLYDAQSLRPLGELKVAWEPRWDPVDRDLLYYNMGAGEDVSPRLMVYNTRTGTHTLVHDFAADFPDQSLTAVWTREAGGPSRDGRYWGLIAQDLDWKTTAVLVYDRRENRVIGRRDLRGVPGGDSVNFAQMSPLGSYLIADFADRPCEPGVVASDSNPCGIMVYDRELKTGRGLLRGKGPADVAVDAQGREVLVFQDPNTDQVAMLDLVTGAVTQLLPVEAGQTPLGLQVSGRAFNRPGWVVISTHNGGRPASLTWMDDQIILLELKAGGRVVRLAHTRSPYDDQVEQDYWTEPNASANQDLTRIVFTTNWGRMGSAEMEVYLIDLPTAWSTHVP